MVGVPDPVGPLACLGTPVDVDVGPASTVFTAARVLIDPPWAASRTSAARANTSSTLSAGALAISSVRGRTSPSGATEVREQFAGDGVVAVRS